MLLIHSFNAYSNSGLVAVLTKQHCTPLYIGLEGFSASLSRVGDFKHDAHSE